MQTIHLETVLPAPADNVWEAMKSPATFLYVVRGVFGVPALTGRTTPMRAGERGTGWVLLFHVLPLTRHTIELVDMDEESRTLRSREHGGVVRTWNHTLHVEPVDDCTSRYSDTVEIDAGMLTAVVAWGARGIYRYRHRRWHKLARKHLSAHGPVYARTA